MLRNIIITFHVTGNALDELHLDDLNLTSLDRELDVESPTVSNSISVGLASAGLLSSSTPVNIPGATRQTLGGFSPSNNSPLQQLHNSFLTSARFSQSDSIDSFLNHSQMQLSSNPSTKINSYPGFFDFSTQSISPSSRNHNNFSISPSLSNNLETARLRDELSNARLQIANWEERLAQARTACEAWQRESEEANRKVSNEKFHLFTKKK